MTQTEARERAKELSENLAPAVFIAGAVPFGSWGGQERGWAVYRLYRDGNDAKLSWWEGTE